MVSINTGPFNLMAGNIWFLNEFMITQGRRRRATIHSVSPNKHVWISLQPADLYLRAESWLGPSWVPRNPTITNGLWSTNVSQHCWTNCCIVLCILNVSYSYLAWLSPCSLKKHLRYWHQDRHQKGLSCRVANWWQWHRNPAREANFDLDPISQSVRAFNLPSLSLIDSIHR